MPVSTSPRTKPRSALGERAGLLRDLAIVLVCVALAATLLAQLWGARAPEVPRADRPVAPAVGIP